MEKICVITGASSGIGTAFAKKFKEEGFRIVNLSRSKSEVADENIKVDLSNPDEISKALAYLIDKVDKIDVLINNAGVGLYESWEETKIEELRYIFEINYFAPVMITKTLLPLIEKTKGTIINVSSVAGKMHIPFMGGYCSTKFALNAFSYSLRAELKEKGVNVLNLIVGRISTGFSKNALGTKVPPETPEFGASAEKLAEKTFKAYKKRKREITYPYWYKFLIFVSRAFPNLYDTLALKKWK